MSRQVDVKALVSHIVHGDGADKCRICMGETGEGQMHLEDTVMMDGDKAVTLAELLEVITGVQVEIASPLPQIICQSCHRELKATIPFVKLCRTSTMKWVELTESFLDIKVNDRTTNVYIEVGQNVKVYKDTIRAVGQKITTKKQALQSFRLRQHRYSAYHRRREREFNHNLVCPECRKAFKTLTAFNHHLFYLNKRCCEECFQIVDWLSIGDHYQLHNITIFVCKCCAKVFCVNNCKRCPPKPCRGCAAEFIHQAYLIHKKSHDNTSVKCWTCKEPFKSRVELNFHTKKHEYMVCGCGKRFSNRLCLRCHKKTCSLHQEMKKQPKFICDYCDVMFNAKSAVLNHIQINHLSTGWLHQCDRCGRPCRSNANLLEHLETHSDKKRYLCLCGVKYASRRGFAKHFETKHKHLTLTSKKSLVDLGLNIHDYSMYTIKDEENQAT